MSGSPQDALVFYAGVQRGVRARAGKAMSRTLRRWRNTLSGDACAPALSLPLLRFLARYGWLDAASGEDEAAAVFAGLVRQIARATGDAAGVVGAWLEAFAAGSYGVCAPVCGETPECPQCPLAEGCRFLSSGARPVQVSGAEMARALTRGESSPRAAELLAYFISGGRGGTGALARAEALLKARGSVRGVLAASPAELRKEGLSEAAAANLRAVGALFDIWSEEREPRGKAFREGRDFYEHFRLRLRNLKREHFYVACLDQRHRLLGEERVSEGSLTETLVHPREVFLPAVRMQAAAVVVVHNHPSGDPSPSPQDKDLTKRLAKASDIVGIRLLDHIIVGDGDYTSFVDERLL